MTRLGAALAVMTAMMGSGALAQATPPVRSGPFVTDQARSEWRTSKFVGLDVYDSDGQKIGDVSEILMDALGNAKTVVIGVGGFLGIGEKAVAVPFTALEWVTARPAKSAAQPPLGGTASPTNGAVVTETTMPPQNSEEEAAYHGYPDHAVVKLSRAELQAAPTFKYYAQTHPAPGTGSPPPVKP